ncbi:hypothetical protein GGS23DRAFT_548612 [Durotheca rogersii]|uniref:uncharacterized protein n=1 Tax=Durotheca rogersii TaxID=419775 RepID=UPI00221EA1AB|nr:uncharacterized protein GGS23DRAFT_548612 [Durotheca rogersii]KAI5867494.1 hypothetical protein GGS23DRAFT_548612 [Durotheca rogersii]
MRTESRADITRASHEARLPSHKSWVSDRLPCAPCLIRSFRPRPDRKKKRRQKGRRAEREERGNEGDLEMLAPGCVVPPALSSSFALDDWPIGGHALCRSLSGRGRAAVVLHSAKISCFGPALLPCSLTHRDDLLSSPLCLFESPTARLR